MLKLTHHGLQLFGVKLASEQKSQRLERKHVAATVPRLQSLSERKFLAFF